MGPKITVDSSTLMNKGLEVIEAHELFGDRPVTGVGIGLDQIDVVVHPQSIVHSMVDLHRRVDDRPAVASPTCGCRSGTRWPSPTASRTPFGAIDWAHLRRLDFEPPDHEAFPCLGLAYEAGRLGETAPAALNAANEVAVEAFLAGQISWTAIPEVLKRVLARHDGARAESADVVIETDQRARAEARQVIAAMS